MTRKSLTLSFVTIFALMLMMIPVVAQQYESYVVQQGDYLSKIALRYCTSWTEVYNINRQTIGNDPNNLNAGSILTIPNRCGGTVRPPSGGGVYDRGPRTHATGSIQGSVYSVGWGDTLFSISERFGLTTNALASANSITQPNSIYAGQRLTIVGLPGGGTVAPPISQSAGPASRTFGYSECTLEVYSTTNIWNIANGSVIGNIEAGSYSALQTQRINGALWYQVEYIETTPWIHDYLVTKNGNCNL
jgi:LysM repeat protein